MGAAGGDVVEAPAVPRIEVRACGVGQVYRERQLLSAKGWGRSALGRELFFYLLETAARRKEEIGATFWPDLSLARMTSTFHAAKYKARRALGIDFVIYQDELYRISDAASFPYDVAEFRRLVDTARHRAPDDPERPSDLQQAVALYSADYLTDVYSDWAAEVRRELRAHYFDALGQVVDALLLQGDTEQVLSLCRRGVDLDFFHEELHRATLRALAQAGRSTEALAYYEWLAHRLQEELGARPEPATIALAASLRSAP